MRKPCFILSCLFVCAASVSAQTNFGSIDIGQSSTMTVTATFTNPTTLTSIVVDTAGTSNLDFTNAGGGTCTIGTSYAANDTCTIQVKFSPKMAGPRYGGFALTNQLYEAAAQGYLQGAGYGPQTGFLPATQTILPSAPLIGPFVAPQGLAADENGYFYAVEGQFFFGHDEPATNGIVVANVPGFKQPGASGPNPSLAAVDGEGNFYSSQIETFFVNPPPPFSGGTDLPFRATQFSTYTVDGLGNLYAGCTAGTCLWTLQSYGTYVQSTIADGITPVSIAVDGSGNIFIANGAVYKFTPSGGGTYSQSTVASSSISASAVAVDGVGNVYINGLSGTIYKEAPQSDGTYTQTTLGGSAFGDYLAVDPLGNTFVFESTGPYFTYTGYGVFEEKYSAPPTLTFASTIQNSTSSSQTVTITNSGNLPLLFSAITSPADFTATAPASGGCTAETTLNPGENCILNIAFAPVTPVSSGASAILTESVLVSTNIGNAPGTQQAISATGTELAQAAAPSFSLPAGIYNTAQTVTISNGTPGAKIYYTFNGSTPTTSSLVANGPVAINAAETLKAVAIKAGILSSPVISAYYAITAPTPTITMTGSGPSEVVTITTATPIEAIFYTTAGNLPTTSSAHYTGPLTLPAGTRVMAFACQTGFINSPTVSAVVTSQASTTAPSFSLPGAVYNTAQSVTISDSTPGAKIYYTLNGSTPTTSSLVANGPIAINASETLNAIAVASGYPASTVTSATYTLTAPTPTITITPSGGSYLVTIATATPIEGIFYTTAGNLPTTSSAHYTGPFTVTGPRNVIAFAGQTGFNDSPVVWQSIPAPPAVAQQ
jgi:hypothetical protein